MSDILLIDDDRDIRDALRDLLEDEGYTVRMAANGADGFSELGRGLPRLVVLDLLMPVMDGAEFLAKLRADERYATVQVLVLSASSTVALPEGARLVRKPVHAENFLADVKAKIGEPS